MVLDVLYETGKAGTITMFCISIMIWLTDVSNYNEFQLVAMWSELRHNKFKDRTWIDQKENAHHVKYVLIFIETSTNIIKPLKIAKNGK